MSTTINLAGLRDPGIYVPLWVRVSSDLTKSPMSVLHLRPSGRSVALKREQGKTRYEPISATDIGLHAASGTFGQYLVVEL